MAWHLLELAGDAGFFCFKVPAWLSASSHAAREAYEAVPEAHQVAPTEVIGWGIAFTASVQVSCRLAAELVLAWVETMKEDPEDEREEGVNWAKVLWKIGVGISKLGAGTPAPVTKRIRREAARKAKRETEEKLRGRPVEAADKGKFVRINSPEVRTWGRLMRYNETMCVVIGHIDKKTYTVHPRYIDPLN